MPDDFYFQVGTSVRKVSGYRFDGVVVAAFYTLAGMERYVVDNGDGLLHIFQLRQLTANPDGLDGEP